MSRRHHAILQLWLVAALLAAGGLLLSPAAQVGGAPAEPVSLPQYAQLSATNPAFQVSSAFPGSQSVAPVRAASTVHTPLRRSSATALPAAQVAAPQRAGWTIATPRASSARSGRLLSSPSRAPPSA